MALAVAAIFFSLFTFAYMSFAILRASPDRDISDGYLAIGNAFLLVLLLIVSLVYVDSRRQKAKANARAEQTMVRVLQRLDSVFSARTGLSSYLIRHASDPAEHERSLERSSEFLRFLVDETRTMFEEYTTHPCSVSIKLFVPSEGAPRTPRIKTYIRDAKSALKRQQLYPPDGTYPFSDHSPFVSILSGEGEDYFFSNNLKSDAARGLYRNGNPYWRKFYNSTLIVPIREPDIIASENILGFLCVDSVSAKFDADSALYMARIVANAVFYVISALSELEGGRSQTQNSRKAADG